MNFFLQKSFEGLLKKDTSAPASDSLAALLVKLNNIKRQDANDANDSLAALLVKINNKKRQDADVPLAAPRAKILGSRRERPKLKDRKLKKVEAKKPGGFDHVLRVPSTTTWIWSRYIHPVHCNNQCLCDPCKKKCAKKGKAVQHKCRVCGMCPSNHYSNRCPAKDWGYDFKTKLTRELKSQKLNVGVILVRVKHFQGGHELQYGLHRRSRKLKHGTQQLSMPGGLHDKVGETAREAAARELEEESGISYRRSVNQLIPICARGDRNGHPLRITFAYFVDSGKSLAPQEEYKWELQKRGDGRWYHWYTLKEISKLTDVWFPAIDKEVVNEYKVCHNLLNEQDYATASHS